MRVGDIGPAEFDLADEKVVQGMERRKSLLVFGIAVVVFFFLKRK